jgi:hypothetical protein
MHAMRLGFVLVALGLAGGVWPVAAPSAEGTPGAGAGWQYRVLTRDHVLDLGKKDLAAGLNKLGADGWELAAIDTVYIFKRPLNARRQSARETKAVIALLESQVEMQQERVAWVERMLRKGFVSARQVEDERRWLKSAEDALEQARRELVPAPPPHKEPADKEGPPDK